MEEVDEIVIHTLRQIGCDIEESTRSLREFSTELVFEGVVRCLKVIKPTLEISHHVPPSMSARYRIGSALAAECSDLGYNGEIGYQTFLYSNETELRKVFLFLIEKLPKEGEKTLDQPLGKLALLLRETSVYLKECLNLPWLPYYCKMGSNTFGSSFFTESTQSGSINFEAHTLAAPFLGAKISDSMKALYSKYCSQYLPLFQKQVRPYSNMVCSVIESNMLALVKEQSDEWKEDDLVVSEKSSTKKGKIKEAAVNLLNQAVLKYSPLDSVIQSKAVSVASDEAKLKGSRFCHTLELQYDTAPKSSELSDLPEVAQKSVDTEEEKRRKREEEIAEMQAKVDEITAIIEQYNLSSKTLESSIQQLKDKIKSETEKIEALKETYRVKKCTLSLLPDAENNVKKLEELVESSSQRLISLAEQWEQHRIPLIDKYRELKEASSQRLNETQKRLEMIKQLHDKIKDTGAEASHKEEMHKQLLASYEKMTKDLNRSAYTRRILEIVANIKKQKAEIDKVLLDTRNVQKEINRLSGKLERTFTVTDELIFKDAKKDEAVRRAYKLLAALHENCSLLVQLTEETGFIIREIREIEDHIEQENQKKVVATLERITSDYKQMQQENALLLAKLK